METDITYDVCIVGGGLSGLSLSILLAKNKIKVICLEKEQYPFHRVCGEYISMESWPFLKNLGLELDSMELPRINKLQVSAPSGKLLHANLDLGGFGISRYKLDLELCTLAKSEGVTVLENSKVSDICFKDGVFSTILKNTTIFSKIAIATIGKRSNLDIKWERQFIKQKQSKLNNYIGVKYHIETSFPADTIALHNFKNGYCGVSKIEDNKFCLCYLTTAKNLKQSNNSIIKMEETILSKNPHIKKLLTTSKKLFEEPVTISQISFDKKELFVDHIIMSGDAAGMITPLCGNGMSIAFRSAHLLSPLLIKYLSGSITRQQLETIYKRKWDKAFSFRLKTGQFIQIGRAHV